MKKLVCGCFGTIYYAQVFKNGTMSSTNREDVTDDAILAVLQHCMNMDGYLKNGFAGYDYKIGNVPVEIIAFDKSKWKLVPKDNVSEESK